VLNIIEQDHRRSKRLSRLMLGFKIFHTARRTLAGMEVMARIKKGPMYIPGGNERSSAGQLYALVAKANA